MEIEAKFSVPDLKTFQQLQAADHVGSMTLSAARTKQVHDTYLDTSARLILAAGYACRRRECDGEYLITLKQLGSAQGAIHRREELEVRLATHQSPAQWPDSPARDRVLELIGSEPLTPLFELYQTRIVRWLGRGEQVLAELSLDDVRAVVDKNKQAYLELEVELTPPGSEEDLRLIVQCLQDEWGLRPEPRSKFEQAMTLVGEARAASLLTDQEYAACLHIAAQSEEMYRRRAQALLALNEGASQAEAGQRAGLSARRVRHWLAEFRRKRLDIFLPSRAIETSADAALQSEPPLPAAPGVESGDSMAEAARKTLLFHYQRMIHHEPGTRLGQDIEALHDMRVATRRMRAALNVFGDYVDMAAMRSFIKRLQRTGRALGAVRDLDVFQEKTRRYLDTLPAERQTELDALLAVWQTKRDEARQHLLAYLDSERYTRFKQEFGEFLQTPTQTPLPLSEQSAPLPHRVQHVLPVIAYQWLANVQAYDEWIAGPDTPLTRFHQLRITSKRLRYTLEFFRQVLGTDVEPLIDEIKKLQDHLGDLQDAVVTCNLLRDFLTWGAWGQAKDDLLAQENHTSQPDGLIVAPGVAAYLAVRQAELQSLVDTFPRVWARIQNPQFNQRLAAVIGTACFS